MTLPAEIASTLDSLTFNVGVVGPALRYRVEILLSVRGV